MSFGKDHEVGNIFHSDHDKENKIWRRLSSLILGSRDNLRKFLCTINQDLYVELQNQAKKEVENITKMKKSGILKS